MAASSHVDRSIDDPLQFIKTNMLGTASLLYESLKYWNNYNNGYLTMDQIAIACALDYASFRFTNKWKNDHIKLNKWFNTFLDNEYMKSTLPKI